MVLLCVFVDLCVFAGGADVLCVVMSVCVGLFVLVAVVGGGVGAVLCVFVGACVCCCCCVCWLLCLCVV